MYALVCVCVHVCVCVCVCVCACICARSQGLPQEWYIQRPFKSGNLIHRLIKFSLADWLRIAEDILACPLENQVCAYVCACVCVEVCVHVCVPTVLLREKIFMNFTNVQVVKILLYFSIGAPNSPENFPT